VVLLCCCAAVLQRLGINIQDLMVCQPDHGGSGWQRAMAATAGPPPTALRVLLAIWQQQRQWQQGSRHVLVLALFSHARALCMRQQR
jgi:hypothetical protein